MTRGVAVPPQFPPDSSARIVLLSVAVPMIVDAAAAGRRAIAGEGAVGDRQRAVVLDAAAGSPALLPEKVLLVTVSVP